MDAMIQPTREEFEQLACSVTDQMGNYAFPYTASISRKSAVYWEATTAVTPSQLDAIIEGCLQKAREALGTVILRGDGEQTGRKDSRFKRESKTCRVSNA